IAPMNFFLWSYIKEKMYATQPTTIANMKLRI
ncbi:hypothetical protein EAI_06129, partial [Harpegnathos saltator]